MSRFPSLAFETSRIEEQIRIRAVLHVNQDDPRFGGRGNPNLSGKATHRRENGWVLVEAKETVPFPLAGSEAFLASQKTGATGGYERESCATGVAHTYLGAMNKHFQQVGGAFTKMAPLLEDASNQPIADALGIVGVGYSSIHGFYHRWREQNTGDDAT